MNFKMSDYQIKQLSLHSKYGSEIISIPYDYKIKIGINGGQFNETTRNGVFDYLITNNYDIIKLTYIPRIKTVMLYCGRCI